MVFQNYALYPHMTVRENLSFGLKIRRTARDVIASRVQEVSKNLEIDALLDRKPAELSGGQRQRVALGRAVIREPQVFLFDEPLSNLDARLRDEMRYLIKRLYQRLETTTVYVTHDQVEAMTIGELLVVLRDGRVHQVGTPAECYQRPHDTFVASFLGSPPMNLIDGRYDGDARAVRIANQQELKLPDTVAKQLEGAGDVVIGVRPEHLVGDTGHNDGLVLGGSVVLEESLGHEVHTHVDSAGHKVVVRGAQRLPGDGENHVAIRAPVDSLHFFSKDTGIRLGSAGAG
jgi:ABC-type sugar transport system ATPase subunit